jgi:hypothetical protein
MAAANCAALQGCRAAAAAGTSVLQLAAACSAWFSKLSGGASIMLNRLFNSLAARRNQRSLPLWLLTGLHQQHCPQ